MEEHHAPPLSEGMSRAAIDDKVMNGEIAGNARDSDNALAALSHAASLQAARAEWRLKNSHRSEENVANTWVGRQRHAGIQPGVGGDRSVSYNLGHGAAQSWAGALGDAPRADESAELGDKDTKPPLPSSPPPPPPPPPPNILPPSPPPNIVPSMDE